MAGAGHRSARLSARQRFEINVEDLARLAAQLDPHLMAGLLAPLVGIYLTADRPKRPIPHRQPAHSIGAGGDIDFGLLGIAAVSTCTQTLLNFPPSAPSHSALDARAAIT